MLKNQLFLKLVIIKRFNYQRHSTLYFSNGSWSQSVFEYDTYNNTLLTNTIISKDFYSLGFNNNYIYGLDVKDYVQNGWSFRYTTNGELVDSTEVGIIPGGFCFR